MKKHNPHTHTHTRTQHQPVDERMLFSHLSTRHAKPRSFRILPGLSCFAPSTMTCSSSLCFLQRSSSSLCFAVAVWIDSKSTSKAACNVIMMKINDATPATHWNHKQLEPNLAAGPLHPPYPRVSLCVPAVVGQGCWSVCHGSGANCRCTVMEEGQRETITRGAKGEMLSHGEDLMDWLIFWFIYYNLIVRGRKPIGG